MTALPSAPGVAVLDLIRHHVAYNEWATNRLLSAVALVDAEGRLQDFGTADKSMQGTLTHLLRSERNWLNRLYEGTPSSPHSLPEDEQWETLLTQWCEVQERWRDWVSAQQEQDVQATCSYTDLQNRPWEQPVWQIVLHVVNHSTHHRGQVSGFLRASGKTPPPLDFIAFVRHRQATAS